MRRQTFFFLLGLFFILLLVLFAYTRRERREQANDAERVDRTVVARSSDELVRAYISQMQALRDDVDLAASTTPAASTIADKISGIPVLLEFRDDHMALFLMVSKEKIADIQDIVAAFDRVLQRAATMTAATTQPSSL